MQSCHPKRAETCESTQVDQMESEQMYHRGNGEALWRGKWEHWRTRKKDLSPKASEAFEQENIEQLRGFSRIKLDQE